ncbi:MULTISPECIES: hypothetical protein [Salinivibrio]|nr:MULTISPECIES: hypothetical protein [Salinivibrio]
MMIARIKRWVAGYDAWCQRMGLGEDNRRSCVPIKRSEKTSSTPTSQHD